MNISYRKATTNDLNEILAIYNCIIAEGGYTADLDPYTIIDKRNWFEKVNKYPYGIFVVEENNVIIGYFYLSPWREGRNALNRVVEISYYLGKSYRGNQIGVRMVQWCIDEAKKQKFQFILAILLDINKRSESLLQRFGFRVEGRLKGIANVKGKICGQLIMLKKINSN